MLIGAVTSTSISLFFNASEDFFKELNESSPDLVVALPKLISISSLKIFSKFTFLGLASFMLLMRLKLKSCIRIAFLWIEATFDDPNTIGVQKSIILISLKVFMIISNPIPFKSPIEIPNFIFDIMICS